ncbi:MAG: acetate--CoA ligase family protein [Myxococcota bacterium]
MRTREGGEARTPAAKDLGVLFGPRRLALTDPALRAHFQASGPRTPKIVAPARADLVVVPLTRLGAAPTDTALFVVDACESGEPLPPSRGGALRVGPGLGFGSPCDGWMLLAEARPLPEAGHVALVTQGGALLVALLDGLGGAGVGISRFVDIGGGSDVDVVACLAWLAADDATRAIVVAVGVVSRAADLVATVERAAALRKPVLALRIRAAADADTAFAADVEDAAMRQRGALVFGDADDLVETARAFARLGARPPARIVVSASKPSLAWAARAIAAVAGIDTAPSPGALVLQIPRDLPLVGARAHLAALRRAADGLRQLERGPRRPPAAPRGARERALDFLTRAEPTLTERETKDLLAIYGIEAPPEEIVSSPSSAATAARRVGFPVSLRVVTPDIRDLAGAGAIASGVTNGAQARGAYVRVLVAARRAAPSARLEGVVIAKTPPTGVRLRVATRLHPSLGPAITLGLAGEAGLAQLDQAVAACPLSLDEAAALVRDAPASRLLLGRKAAPAPDARALVRTLAAVSILAWDLRDAIRELDLTLVVRPHDEGCVVVEAAATR